MAATSNQKGMPPWRTKRREMRVKPSSSTAGKDKGSNCQATGLEKAMAKYPRSYKNNNRILWAAWDKQCQQFWK